MAKKDEKTYVQEINDKLLSEGWKFNCLKGWQHADHPNINITVQETSLTVSAETEFYKLEDAKVFIDKLLQNLPGDLADMD